MASVTIQYVLIITKVSSHYGRWMIYPAYSQCQQRAVVAIGGLDNVSSHHSNNNNNSSDIDGGRNDDNATT